MPSSGEQRFKAGDKAKSTGHTIPSMEPNRGKLFPLALRILVRTPEFEIKVCLAVSSVVNR
jgi:hypothetical protein